MAFPIKLLKRLFYHQSKGERASIIFGTREGLGRNPDFDKICAPYGGHVWITASPFGEDCFCVRCWHEIGMAGILLHGDPVDEDTRKLLLDGWIRIPKEPTFGHGMTPCWSRKKEDWLEKVWDEIIPMREFMKSLTGISAK